MDRMIKQVPKRGYFDERAYVNHIIQAEELRFDYRQALASGSWRQWQSGLRAALQEATGLSRIQNLNRSWQLVCREEAYMETETYTREKRYLMTEPGIEIPFYLLLPKKREGAVPLVLCPHGHNRRGKEMYVGNVESAEERAMMSEGDRDIALQAVEQGYAAIAPDVRGFWEMAREIPEGEPSHYSRRHWMSVLRWPLLEVISTHSRDRS